MDDNWLEAEVLNCPTCEEKLFAVSHSPFHDDHLLYCDRCPKALEISYYDPVYQRVVDQLPRPRMWEGIMAAIEPQLKPCSCGGRFRGTASRRCFSCGSVVPAAARKDLTPYAGYEDTGRDPTAEEFVEHEQFIAEFVVRSGRQAWTDGH